jgi:acetyl esterase/lipase
MSEDPRLYLPASVSAEAAGLLRTAGAMFATMPKREPPSTIAEFDAALEQSEAFAAHMGAEMLEDLSPEVVPWRADGVPVLTVRTIEAKADAAPLVYIHGGGFVQGSARSSLGAAAMASKASGRVVYSIDYTLAPRANWRQILEEVVSVWAAVTGQHSAAPGLFGDSAGGCIAAAATLEFRAHGHVMPGALALLSPLLDLAGSGDTNKTLAAVDFLDEQTLLPGLRAYAPEAEWRNPLVSPLYGDFRPGFPPTLIQVGTREILLSDSVRLHRTLRAAGQSTRLEVYEGMPHVFQRFLAQTPEGKDAWDEMAQFWREHLA